MSDTSAIDKMREADASTLCEDNLMLRECEHGIRHPVGRLDGSAVRAADYKTRHEREVSPHGYRQGVTCCGCFCPAPLDAPIL